MIIVFFLLDSVYTSSSSRIIDLLEALCVVKCDVHTDKVSVPDGIWFLSTFAQDCEDSNPLIRALAVRTMGCIRVDKITEYLCEPLRKCLKDEDPYVRKTAAVCVAKLHDINAQLVEDQGFLDSLRDLLSDSNPMVCAFSAVLLLFL